MAALATWGVAGLLLLSACGSGGASAGGSGGSGGSTGSPAAAGSGSGRAAASGHVGVGGTTAGRVMVDPQGMTMYAFAADSRGHSTCSGSCATYWPPVPGKDASRGATRQVTAKLGTIKRADGSSQLTVNGYPMYTYAGDSGPGQATGQGKNLSGGLWWVVSPSGSWIKTHGKAASTGGGLRGY